MNNKLGSKLANLAAKSGVVRALMPKFGGLGHTAKQYAPEAYLVLGIAAGVAAGISLAKAYKRHDEVFEDVIEDIHEVHNTYSQELPEEFTDEQAISEEETKELVPLYLDAAGRALRLYGPSLLLGVSSVYLLLTSHGVMRGRNKALFAAAQVLEHGFSTYRKRVIEEAGVEADERYLHGASVLTINDTEIDEDGKKKKTSRKTNAIPEQYSPMVYSRVFDETNHQHVSDRDMNLFLLRAVERTANDVLTIKGVVLLNDVYDDLGIPRSAEGAVVGWTLKGPGDDFVDFGLDKSINKHTGDNRFILDFNVNGPVYEYYNIKR